MNQPSLALLIQRRWKIKVNYANDKVTYFKHLLTVTQYVCVCIVLFVIMQTMQHTVSTKVSTTISNGKKKRGNSKGWGVCESSHYLFQFNEITWSEKYKYYLTFTSLSPINEHEVRCFTDKNLIEHMLNSLYCTNTKKTTNAPQTLIFHYSELNFVSFSIR